MLFVAKLGGLCGSVGLASFELVLGTESVLDRSVLQESNPAPQECERPSTPPR